MDKGTVPEDCRICLRRFGGLGAIYIACLGRAHGGQLWGLKAGTLANRSALGPHPPPPQYNL